MSRPPNPPPPLKRPTAGAESPLLDPSGLAMAARLGSDPLGRACPPACAEARVAPRVPDWRPCDQSAPVLHRSPQIARGANYRRLASLEMLEEGHAGGAVAAARAYG